jgi:hypothetical protein
MEAAESICINCHAAVTTEYCGNCGQKYPPKRLSLLTLYTDFQSRIYGFDGMFPRTVKDLTIRPGKVSAAYIDGNRTRYVAPVGYFFLAITFYLLFMEILGINFYELNKSSMPVDFANGDKSQEAFQKYFTDLVGDYIKIFSFLLIPIIAVFALLFFRKQKLNILEHSVLAFYTYGHAIWFSILTLFIYKIFDLNLNALQLFIQTFLFALGCTTLYKNQSTAKSFIKGVAVVVLATLLYIIVIGTFGLFKILNDPQLMELLRKSKS